jgi:phosphatidylglycerophosphate synthase
MFSRARDIYRLTRKPVDNFWTVYLSRPPAALFVALLEKTPATPNQITFLSFFVGLASAVLLALSRGHLSLLAAALLFQLAYTLDCVDGMLARARRTSSPQGHLLDFLMDELKALAFFGAASLRLYFETGSVWFLVLGAL